MPTPDASMPADGSGASSVRRELAHHARRLARPTTVRDLSPRSLVTLSACLLATLLAVASAAGPAAEGATAGVVAAAAVVLAAGWTRVVGLPSRRGTLITVGLSAALLLASVLVPADGATLRWVPAALAMGVVTAFLHQLVRRDGRPRVVSSLSGTLMALAVTAAGVTWVALPSLPHGADAATTAWVALAAAAAVEWACHRARWWAAMVPGALLAAAAAAALVATLLHVALPWSVLLGLAVAAPSVATRAVFAPLPALVSSRAQAVSGVASVLVAGPVVEVVARHALG
ncbi:hypothetical protein [Arsenicicoccus sp. oral taxon 190]|uniref:hypothetical protein n=1 Tax=Arsenicicoccus sp. oral taxon 190 TaxID=1658671 RepID=UPI00067C7B1F|nr:hypothetical protein [Arsenicicoccus sp. oral taxon 190]